MYHRVKTKTIVTDIYTCERCGREVMFLGTVTCPEHGEFCCRCHNEKESRFPLEICPDCKITWNEAMKGAHINGPNLQFDKIDLPYPYIVIRDDVSGVWIGSKKPSEKLKIRATIAKPGRIIRVYEE